MRFLIFSFIFLIATSSCLSQNDPFTIEGSVTDAQSNQPVMYATVINLSTNKGAVTSPDGFFSLENVNVGDKLRVSFIGYKTSEIVVREQVSRYNVRLEPDVALLASATILGDNSYLYNLIEKCRKSRDHKLQTSKCYYSLENYVDSVQMELVEAYFNGSFRSANVESLEMKAGRAGLRKFGDTFHFSRSSSRAFIMHKLYDDNDYFPHSPLEYKARKMKMYFDLGLKRKSKNEEGQTIFVISFEPRDDPGYFFSGECHIDSTTNTLLKIDLEIKNAKRHPFVPIIPEDVIENVDMRISRTFNMEGDRTYFHHMDFDYSIVYNGVGRNPYETVTEAVIFAFENDAEYTLPYSPVDLQNVEDYRQIDANKHNPYFWENCADLTLKQEDQRNERFYSSEDVWSHEHLFMDDRLFELSFLEGGVQWWSERRIINFVQVENDINDQYWNQAKITLPFRLDSDLYLDLNECGDSLNYVTGAMMNPYTSYYNPPQDSLSRAFINIYHDLTEIARRRLEGRLNGSLSADEALNVYQEERERLRIDHENYLDQVERGEKKRSLKRWNELVFEQLGIDNLEIFGVLESPD